MSHKSDRASARQRTGFTLLELVVVIAIIAVLASIVAPNLMRHATDAKVQAARSQMELLSLALEAYHLDMDDYPSTEQGLELLRVKPVDLPNAQSWRGPYIKREIPVDPWGRPYKYRYPGVNDSTSFEIATFGKDGVVGGTGDAKDIMSWDAGSRAK